MKTKLTLLTALASLGALAGATAQTAVTPPAGYMTETIAANAFNLLSPNLSNAVDAAGDIESTGANTVTDTDVDFTTLLTTGTNYTLKITGGGGLGYNTEITSWTADTLTTMDDLSSVITVGDTYEVRATPTVADVFGAANETDLQTGVQTVADLIWIPDGTGGFTRIYSNGTDWKEFAVFLGTRENEPVYFTNGVFVQNQNGTGGPIVFVGHVETAQTVTPVEMGFNYTSRILPVEVTLGDSGLAATLTSGTQTEADLIWNPDGSGGYTRFYYNGTDWKEFAVFLGTKEDIPLRSGFLIERQTGTPGNAILEIPAGLDI